MHLFWADKLEDLLVCRFVGSVPARFSVHWQETEGLCHAKLGSQALLPGFSPPVHLLTQIQPRL